MDDRARLTTAHEVVRRSAILEVQDIYNAMRELNPAQWGALQARIIRSLASLCDKLQPAGREAAVSETTRSISVDVCRSK